jgi:hypothetical protein
MPQVGFELTIPVFERVKIVHALDHTATVIGSNPVSSVESQRTFWRRRYVPLKLYLIFNGQQKIELFISTVVRTSDSTRDIVFCEVGTKTFKYYYTNIMLQRVKMKVCIGYCI